MPSFRPSVHGWPFPDDYDCPAALIGLGRPVAPEFGLAGGMCWAAIDRFAAGRRIPRTVHAPGAEDPLYAEFILRLANVLAKDTVARAAAAQRMPDSGRTGSLGRLARAEWARARKEMDAGRPVLLLLIGQRGPFADPTGNRFVLGARYEADSERATVWTYDPRRPGDDAATLLLDLGKGSAAFSGRMGRDEHIRGLIAVPYDRAAPPAVEASVAPVGERQRVGLEPDLAAVEVGPNGAGVLARDTDGHLVFMRATDGGWTRERPADLGDVGADFRFDGPPVLAGVTSGRPGVAMRGVNGHLLFLRKGSRGWSAEDLTDQPNTGLRFRIGGPPLVLQGGRHPVFGAVNPDGNLLIYSWSTVRGWSAENVSKEYGAEAAAHLLGGVAGVVDRTGKAHVLGKNADGELVHFRAETDGRWRAARPGAARAELRRLPIEGTPVVELSDDGAIEVFARGVGGHLLQFRLAEGGRWVGRDLTADAAGSDASLTLATDPRVAGSAAGRRHVFGRSEAGDIVHYAGGPDGTWSAENVTVDRITIGPLFRVEGEPAAAASGRTIVVAARRGAELLLYRWHEGGDWSAENLTVERGAKEDGPRISSDPVLLRTPDAAHLLVLSAAGALTRYRIAAPMGRAGRAGPMGALMGTLGPLLDGIRGLTDRFRKPKKAVGLRASPMAVAAVENAAVDALLTGADEPPAGADTVERPATATAEVSSHKIPAPDDAPSEGAPVEEGAAEGEERRDDQGWGHSSSAAAPWHESPEAPLLDLPDEVEIDHAAASASPDPDLDGADLIRAGSEWTGPQLVEPADAPPADDWDVALDGVEPGHEGTLANAAGDGVVDEEDPAAARIFLSDEEESDEAEAPEAEAPAAEAPPVEAPAAEPVAEAAQPEAAQPEAPADESATEAVPGRPLVDLSFLSDIVQTGEIEPEPATESASEPALSGNGAGVGQAEEPPVPLVVAESRVAPDAPSPTAPTPAEPVVDLEFLATAAEYVEGGPTEAAGMASFLEFLEQD
ncbi:MAG: hypothetical protein ABFS34_15710 [Gemmatimonadota bacterium]